MVIMNDLEWSMLSYYVISYEKFRKVMQQTEKVALTELVYGIRNPAGLGMC